MGEESEGEMICRTIQEAFAYYTECQLATVEKLRSVKKTAQSELRRQQNIADGMVAYCRSWVTVADAERATAVRLAKLLGDR
jgi:hypothetical protein